MAGKNPSNRWKYRLRKTLLLLLFLTPLWSFLIWLSQPDTTLKVVMLDKTAQDFSNIEHRAFTWVLNHNHFVKENGEHYSERLDYLGYFPTPHDLLKTNDLRGATPNRIDSIANHVDIGYFIDTYGSYYQDWETRRQEIPKKGKIYGGLESEDVSLMSALIAKKKLVLAEFSIFGDPTPVSLRRRSEQLLGMKFTGWVGRYFEELDTNLTDEIPKWLPENYENQYDAEYQFKGPGLGFFHESGQLLILQSSDLIHELPIVETEDHLADQLGVDAFIRYPFWFEICEPDTGMRVVSQYRIYASPTGANQMRALGIPQSFPAVLSRPDWKIIYMAGDFTDNPISMFTRYFKGVELLDVLWYDTQNPGDRRKFFWDYYNPFMTGVLTRYLEELKDSTGSQVELPKRSGFATKERLLIDFDAPEVDWSKITDPYSDPSIYDEPFDSTGSQPTIGLAKGYVNLGAFGRNSDAQRFIGKNKIPYAISRFNPNSGLFEVSIPCFSDSTVNFIHKALQARFPYSTVEY